MSETVEVLNQLNFLDSRCVPREEMMLYYSKNGTITTFSEKNGEWSVGGTYRAEDGEIINED